MEYDAQAFALGEDGTRLFYGSRGRGPALVLMDGIGCDGFAWKYLQPDLATDHRVIHVHYRGHGRSGAVVDRGGLDIQTLAKDVERVLDHAGEREAILLGHSMGTQVAFELYRRSPSRVRALLLLCGSYGRVTETFHRTDVLKSVLPAIIAQVDKHRGWARALWGRVTPALAFRVARLSREVDALHIREEDFRPYWEHINLIDPDVFLPLLHAAGEHTAEDLLGEIRVPTLVLAAERDTFTPPELAQSMADRIPGAEIMIIVGGSHAAPVEQPTAILDRIRTFLGSRLAPQTAAERERSAV